jgi:hypothetical protein
MKNCEMKLNGNILTITVDISKEFGVSSSGNIIGTNLKFNNMFIISSFLYFIILRCRRNKIAIKNHMQDLYNS